MGTYKILNSREEAHAKKKGVQCEIGPIRLKGAGLALYRYGLEQRSVIRLAVSSSSPSPHTSSQQIMSRYDPQMIMFDDVISQGATMEEMDFERRRELRRQKREEMRLEAERLSKNDDDEEEAARERRRRARQERLRGREAEEPSGQPDSLVMTNSHSLIESDSVSSSYRGGNDDTEDQALLDRMAKREERRQRRMKEALERQRHLDAETEGQPDHDDDSISAEKSKKYEEEERPSSWRRARYHDGEEEEKEAVVAREEEEAAPEERMMEEKPSRSYLREEELTEEGSHSLVSSNQAESADVVAEEALEGDYVDGTSGSERTVQRNDSEADKEVCEVLHSQDSELKEEHRSVEVREEQRKQNGGLHEEEEEEATARQYRKPERTLSRGSVRSPEVSVADDQDDDDDDDSAARLEAERKLEELKRRRDDAESEEFERMRQKQQESEAELEELKRKREERRKVQEEEERQKKQEEADRKAREEEEKRKMKEEIERRRAEAAEKRQKVEDTVDGEDKPFKCVSPRGSSLKIGERAEFLNKSAQKSTVKTSHSPVVSKIDNRLEQYTSAAQRENKESRSPRSGTVDLPVVTDSIRNIKSMWEKGNVFSTPGSGGTSSAFKEAAVIKTGVAGRINDWLNKTPESGKASGGRPLDLKPVDVTNKRSLWENKGSSPAKVAGRSDTKSVTNGMGH
ncbi:caldesmon 1a isoform X2 [Dunckerocampus dactyliophorus]|uniref:caldesmon 1a isoform X2 n=1 Tax=Dunckerocampus dactyliophorus TaxID=161453 RepID=UPI002406A4B2|nr:caldesmon 1a isoform X2 [Dunckerocampus dactyliophorus]